MLCCELRWDAWTQEATSLSTMAVNNPSWTLMYDGGCVAGLAMWTLGGLFIYPPIFVSIHLSILAIQSSLFMTFITCSLSIVYVLSTVVYLDYIFRLFCLFHLLLFLYQIISIYLSIYLSIYHYLSIYLSIDLSIYLPIYLSIYLSINQSIYLHPSIHPFIYPSICLYTNKVMFPTSWPQMFGIAELLFFFFFVFVQRCMWNLSFCMRTYASRPPGHQGPITRQDLRGRRESFVASGRCACGRHAQRGTRGWSRSHSGWLRMSPPINGRNHQATQTSLERYDRNQSKMGQKWSAAAKT